MALDLRASIFRHEADDEPADDRSNDRPQTNVVQPSTGKGERESVIEEEDSKQRDKVVENISKHASDQADLTGQQGHQRHPESRGRGDEECSGWGDCKFAAVHEL